MSVELIKALPVELRSLGLNEKWLQGQISADPGLLGLGELEIVSKEHFQSGGGRMDFLMRDVEQEIYYEIEIMLGALDESHIIRTIEYWDVERQRRPGYDHRAVIVAEHITGRFFNVIRLLNQNRAVPLIAIKLSTFRIDDKIVFHPITVLDVIEEVDESDVLDRVEKASRADWEKKSNPAFLAIVDKVVSSLRNDNITPDPTYNRGHIALGTTGYNFCWFSPRKAVNCRISFRVPSEIRDTILSELQEKGIDAAPQRTNGIKFGITSKAFEENFDTIISILRRAEEASRI